MKNRSEKKRLDGSSFLLAATIILLFIVHITGIIMFGRKGFAKVRNFLNLFMSNAGLIMVVTSMIIVMITGGIDTSIGSVVAMVCMMLIWMTEKGNINAFPTILIVLVTGYIFGLVQGFLMAYFKMQPFVVTLAGMSFVRGVTSIISQGMTSITNKMFTGITTFRIYLPFGSYLSREGVMIYPHVYPGIIIAPAALAIIFVVLKYTKFGRSIYAVDGNEQSVLLPEPGVRRIKLQVYVLGEFLAGLSGPLFCMNICSGFAEQTKGFEIDAIASSVIGRTLLTGGVGNVTGSLFGVLIEGIIESFITSQGTLSSWRVRITIATLLCFFIVLQSLIASLKRKGK